MYASDTHRGELAKIWGNQEDGGKRNVFKETERMKNYNIYE
mgnify:CR=1 FL=1